MRTVVQIRKGRKPRDVSRDRLTGVPVDPDPRGQRLEMIQALIPIGLEAVRSELVRELEELTGPRHARQGGREGLDRPNCGIAAGRPAIPQEGLGRAPEGALGQTSGLLDNPRRHS